MSFSQLLPATSHLPPFPYVTQPVERSSSMLSRSLPQPPHSVSFGRLASRRSLMLVPPTSQSLPRSPKIASLPSLYLTPVRRQEPFGAKLMHWSGVTRPTLPAAGFASSASQFRKYWLRIVGTGPVFQTLPSALNRTARRGSYSS